MSILLVLAPLALAAPKDDARQERLRQMESRAAEFQVFAGAAEQGDPLKLIPHPLLRFDDPARAFHSASGTSESCRAVVT